MAPKEPARDEVRTIQPGDEHPTVNTPHEAAFARRVLEDLAGPTHVSVDLKPLMTAEDFSFMLRERPGAYIWIGNGASAGLHTPDYDFNDDILTLGAAYWVRLVETALAVPTSDPEAHVPISVGADL